MLEYLRRIENNLRAQSPVLDLSYYKTPEGELPDYDGLVELPAVVFELQHLETLLLSNQFIEHFEEVLAEQLPNLERIVLHNNPLKSIKSQPGLDLDWWQYQKFQHQLQKEHVVGLTGALQKGDYAEEAIFIVENEEATRQTIGELIPKIARLQLPKLKYLKFNNFDLGVEQLSDAIADISTLEQLDLSYNKLKSLPNTFKKLSQLKKLSLCHNHFISIPNELLKLDKLQHLDVTGNYLSKPGPDLAKLKTLTYLNLSQNGLFELHPKTSQLDKLETLVLRDFNNYRQDGSPYDMQSIKGQIKSAFTEKLERMGPPIGQLKDQNTPFANLAKEKEQISKEDTLDNLWAVIKELPALKNIDLAYNDLYSLPEDIDALTHIEKVDLSHNLLSTLDYRAGGLKELRELDLSHNEMNEVPNALLAFKKLKKLRMTNTFFGNVVLNDFSVFEELELLELGDNQLSDTKFMASLTELKQLRYLDLSDNQIQELPAALGELSSLRYLLLNRNQLASLPVELGQLAQLRQLSLARNQLNQLPDTIGQLQQLYQLDLQHNELEWLPDVLCYLEELHELDLQSNKITGLPAPIDHLKKLEWLNLKDNYLRKLSPKLSFLPNIQYLNLSSCSLRKVPRAFFEMPSDPYLDVLCNALISPPLEIVNQGKQAILQYFDELERQKSEYLYEAKLLIVGSPGAGKTTLRLKLLDAQSPLPSAQDSTEGVDIEQMLFPMMDGEQFRMNIWDFGGQELYHSTHQFFFTHRSLYVLVLNTRRDDDRIDYWLHTIQLFGGDSPIIIVQNQEKDRSYPLNEQRYRSQYPQIQEFVQLNLSNAQEIPKLLRKIQYFIQDLPQVGDELPKQWLEVREILAERQKMEAYMSFDDFRDICIDVDIESEDKILLLSQYLHDLGTVLHFNDNPILKHILFLKNNWVIDAAYRVLDNDLIKNQQKGRFTEEQLSEIWSNPEYMKVKDELLELMLKFEICYQIPEKDEYLVPLLLAPNPPAFDFPKNNVIHLSFAYDFMPRGLLTRFVTQTHHYIQNHDLVWKEGVILERLNTLAKVEEDYDHHKIHIKISGERAEEFQAILLDEFDQLHQTYPQQLQVNKLIPCNCSKCSAEEATPFWYEHQKLEGYLKNGRKSVVCDSSYQDVLIQPLLDGITNPLLQSSTEKVQILFLAANPKDTQQLELDKEVELLREVLESGRHQQRIALDQRWEVSYDKLQQTVLKLLPQVIHFSGHGTDAGLLLENEQGHAQAANAATLQGLFSPMQGDIHCVILNACYSENQAKVIAQHIPFVVGMNTAISDEAALLFTRGFYRGLSNRLDIEFAFKMGVNLVQAERPDQVSIFVLWKNEKIQTS